MGVAKPTVAIAVEAGMNQAEDYISRFVFTPTRAQGVGRASGESRYSATAYRVDPLQRLSLGEKSLQRAPLAASVRKRMGLQDFTIFADEYSVECEEDLGTIQSLKESYGLANLESETVAPYLIDMLLIDEETRCAAKLKDTNTFTQGGNLTSAQWTSATTNPLSQLRTGYNAIKKRGKRPNAMVFSKNYWDAFIENEYVKEIFGDNTLTMTRDEISTALTNLIAGHGASPEPIEIRIAGAVGDDANAGASDSLDYLYDSHACMFVRGTAPEGGYADVKELCAAKLYTLREPAVDYYEQDDIEAGVWRAKHIASPEAFDVNLAYTFYNAV